VNELQELYRDVILDHNRRPRNFGELADADRVIEAFNPLCGDKMTLYVKLADGTVTDISAEMVARKEAERSHDRLIAAIESLPATFALYDADDRLVLVNSKLTETLKGWAHCYVPGCTFLEIARCAAASGAVEQARGRERRLFPRIRHRA